MANAPVGSKSNPSQFDILDKLAEDEPYETVLQRDGRNLQTGKSLNRRNASRATVPWPARWRRFRDISGWRPGAGLWRPSSP